MIVSLTLMVSKSQIKQKALITLLSEMTVNGRKARSLGLIVATHNLREFQRTDGLRLDDRAIR
ncbi:hypothetical protein BKM17_23980 [Pseudomonas syringae group genomosp. 3]|nr:hypothetical protein BKM17_23980 [Pseudomonas syringae group genomosp. 3]